MNALLLCCCQCAQCCLPETSNDKLLNLGFFLVAVILIAVLANSKVIITWLNNRAEK